MFSIHTDRQLKEIKKTDLVFIPALVGDMSTAVAKNKNLVPWIQEQYNKGAEVASLCVGAFLLASTGLLNGKKCTRIFSKLYLRTKPVAQRHQRKIDLEVIEQIGTLNKNLNSVYRTTCDDLNNTNGPATIEKTYQFLTIKGVGFP